MNHLILVAGDMADKLVSWGAVSYSNDGYLWSEPVNPFNSRGKAVGIAKGPNNIVAVSDAGLVSSSTDGIDWNTFSIVDGNFSPSAIRYATDSEGNYGTYMVSGQRKFLVDEGVWEGDQEPYFAMDEAAQVFTNPTGENWDWTLVYSYDSPDSRFYNIRRISFENFDAWIAIGSSQSKPIAVYSIDNGSNWSLIEFPPLENIHFAYDVVWNIDKFYFTVNGMILNTPSLSDPVWGASQILTVPYGNTDLIRIATNPAGHMVAVCSGGLFYSLDQTGWTLFRQDGYRFKSITWFNDHWIAGTDSNLTQYTYWSSTDTINWIPYYNTVQIYDSASV